MVDAAAGIDAPLPICDACASTLVDAVAAGEGDDDRMCSRAASCYLPLEAVLMATFGMVMLTSELTLASDV